MTGPPGVVYLDGNSLGPVGPRAEAALAAAVVSWRVLAVRGWTEGPTPWFDLSRRAAGLLAPVLGADPAGVMVGQSATVNLHQLLATYYDPAGGRPRVVLDATHFPTDRYAVDSHLRLRGRDPAEDLVLVPTEGDGLLDEGRLIAAMDDPGVGFAVLPAVVFTTGQLLDLPRLTAEARRRGVTVAWDCSHSAGVVPHAFAADDIGLAFGCTYKWLNGGPGAVGWLYVAPRLLDRPPGLAGWFGCDPARQFEMSAAFHPAADAGRFLLGTPHVLSLAPVVGALEAFRELDPADVRKKSLELTAYLRGLVEAKLSRFGVRVVTPRENRRRGGHLALAHSAAGALSRGLRARNIIPDFRPPDLLRLAPSPLFNTKADCDRAVEVLADLLAAGVPEPPAADDRVP